MDKTSEEIGDIILSTLNSEGSLSSTLDVAQSVGCEHQAVVGAMKSLENDLYVKTTKQSKEFWDLTEEALSYIEHGTPGTLDLSERIYTEFLLYQSVPATGSISVADLQKLLTAEQYKVGFSKCMSNKWVEKKGSDLLRKVPSVVDAVADLLKKVKESGGSLQVMPADSAEGKLMKSRQLAKLSKITFFGIEKGEKYSPKRVKLASDLTKEMIDTGSWKTCQFKEYNFNAFGKELAIGTLHPLLKVRAEFREKLLELGFVEMPTDEWVESSFWNFDALFQPQAHPSRDAQDTFFISDPSKTLTLPEDYLQRVWTQHQEGGNGSFGYGCPWRREEALKNILRTHTTGTSAKMLYKLANQPGGFKPIKHFSIDRVYRNETMDATHLAEFHQVELFVADYNLGLSDLIGMINNFFNKIGIYDLKFKPAFNPYTEPSMEIFGFHPDLNKWTEIGNSGIFRPEMLLPMGLPPNVSVIACGLSLERPTMIKYGIKNIRELFGHKYDLAASKKFPLPRF